MKKIILFSLFTSFITYAQDSCNLHLSKQNEIYAIEANDLKCMAEHSTKKNTLVFTYGNWCEPCRLHLPNAIKLADKYDLNFYVLLVEAEDDLITKQSVSYLKNIKPNIKILILKDAVYGLKRRKKNKKFVTEITPKTLEAIDDYSKYILINNKGEVIMVTNWKDNRENDWRDDTEMVKKRLLPLL